MEQALRRELAEECGLHQVSLTGPIAIAESISPPEMRPRKHVVHVIFQGDVHDREFASITSSDVVVRGHRLVNHADLPAVEVHPPIHRFLERWRPGDPFVHLGQLWAR